MSWFENEGHRIYYEESGTGDPLLLLHGWGGNLHELDAVRDALTSRYRVIAVDTPGCGRSTPQPREYTSSYYQDDSRAFLSLLGERGAAPAHIVGYSDGGEYALLMAEMQPVAVRSVAAWGAAAKVDMSEDILGALEQVIDDPIPAFADFSDYLINTYGKDNGRVMAQSWGRALREIIQTGGDISWDRAGQIACPVLLITGDKDILAPPDIVSELAQRIPGAEFIEAREAGHAVHQASPEWLTQIILGWLSGH
jgi:valacyclovir hydrolase